MSAPARAWATGTGESPRSASLAIPARPVSTGVTW